MLQACLVYRVHVVAGPLVRLLAPVPLLLASPVLAPGQVLFWLAEVFLMSLQAHEYHLVSNWVRAPSVLLLQRHRLEG